MIDRPVRPVPCKGRLRDVDENDGARERGAGPGVTPAATSTGEFQMNLDSQLSAAAAYAAMAFVGAIVLGVI